MIQEFVFLSNAVTWIYNWKDSPESGKLSKQTFTSFKHYKVALMRIVNYLPETYGLEYFLNSFLQNDQHHFGQYRKMAGGYYHLLPDT